MPDCPTCGQPLPADALEVELARIREWASCNGVALVFGDSLRQSDAARYLGRSHKTLRNWGTRLTSRRLRGRVYVTVDDLAGFIVEGGED